MPRRVTLLCLGNLEHQGLPVGDENDLPFEQLVLDSFSAFARRCDPNPDMGLPPSTRLRQYHTRTDCRWDLAPATVDSMVKKTFQWLSHQASFCESHQCNSLNLRLGFYGR